MTIIEALADKKLFLPFFHKHTDWAAWFVFLKTLFGLPLTEEETAIYQHHTGRETPLDKQAREAWLVVGRRGGKSRVASLIATYLAAFIDYRDYLAPGELAFIPIVAVDKRQARQIFRYLTAFFDEIPMLRKLVKRKSTGNEWLLELSNRVQIEVFAGSFRSNRGFTIACFIGDETAFWRSDETSANPDTEILKSVKPGLLTIPNALMLNLSSPYSRKGELWNAYNRYFGKDGDVLVWQGTTEEMHPSVNVDLIEKAREEDPDSAAAEYDAQFRKDLEDYLSREVLEDVVVPGRHELPRSHAFHYVGFADPSGGSADSYTLAIGHEERSKVVLDLVRETRPPFCPEAVTKEYAEMLKSYGVFSVHGDAYAGEWPREQFQKHGVSYQLSDYTKSEIYTEALPLFNSRRVELLDHSRLKAQLLALERRTGRGGKGSIDHPPRGHDDVANAVCGALVRVEESAKYTAGTAKVVFGGGR